MSDALLAAIFSSLDDCRGDRLVAQYFHQNDSSWFTRPWYLIAVGKAAGAMSQGAVNQGADQLVAGLVVVKDETELPINDGRIRWLVASHPIPDDKSLAAGQTLVCFCQRLPDDARVLFLLSGGASSLVEILPNDLSLVQWQAMTEQWLRSGWGIAQINEERRRVSLIKAGKLLSFFPKDCAILELVISDVENNDLSVIGSGLLHADVFDDRVSSYLLASNGDWISGFKKAMPDFEVNLNFVTDSVDDLAKSIAFQATLGRSVVWGGEPLVTIRSEAGRGGRLQHLCLLVMRELQGYSGNWRFIALASDGSDGPTEDAGAVVNQSTWAHASRLGYSVENSIERYDAGTLLEALGALVHTGVTGTNVNDLMVLYCD